MLRVVKRVTISATVPQVSFDKVHNNESRTSRLAQVNFDSPCQVCVKALTNHNPVQCSNRCLRTIINNYLVQVTKLEPDQRVRWWNTKKVVLSYRSPEECLKIYKHGFYGLMKHLLNNTSDILAYDNPTPSEKETTSGHGITCRRCKLETLAIISPDKNLIRNWGRIVIGPYMDEHMRTAGEADLVHHLCADCRKHLTNMIQSFVCRDD